MSNEKSVKVRDIESFNEIERDMMTHALAKNIPTERLLRPSPAENHLLRPKKKKPTITDQRNLISDIQYQSITAYQTQTFFNSTSSGVMPPRSSPLPFSKDAHSYDSDPYCCYRCNIS